VAAACEISIDGLFFWVLVGFRHLPLSALRLRSATEGKEAKSYQTFF
jgi:hypothetical protein